MEDRLTLVKWVDGETRYFPEDMYEAQFINDRAILQIIHKPSKTVSLECSMDQVLYIRYHMPKKKNDDEES